MLKKIPFFVLTLIGLNACTSDTEEIYDSLTESLVQNEISADTIALDSIQSSEIEVFNGDPELLEQMENQQRRNMFASRAVINNPDLDPILMDNLYAIQGVPFSLIVKGVASGCNLTHTSLLANNPNREAALNELKSGSAWEYYIKAHSYILEGFDTYNIYGVATNTPLVVANYSNNKEEKILYLNKEDTPTAYAAQWYLLPSESNRGYFNIASYNYIGQSDPDDRFSLFNYVWEAQAKDKIRYAELVTNKPQQLFKILLLNEFSIDSIQYDAENAFVKSHPSHTEKYTFYNKTNRLITQNAIFPINKNDKSVFHESGSLIIPLKESQPLLPRPVVVGGNKVSVDTSMMKKDAIYQDVFQEIPLADYTNVITLKPKSFVEIEIEYQMFELRVPYTAIATTTFVDKSDGKTKTTTVKITGTWVGYSHGDFEIYAPKMAPPRYYDIATGERIPD